MHLIRKIRDKIKKEIFDYHCVKDLKRIKRKARVASPRKTIVLKEILPTLIFPFQNGFVLFENAGMFKSSIYNGTTERYKNQINQDEVFCLQMVDSNFITCWQVGKSFISDMPYLSHTAEHMAKKIKSESGEILAVLGPEQNLSTYDMFGNIKSSVKLPHDNFAQLFEVPSLEQNQALILVGVTDKAYDGYDYANPWMLFDSDLNLIIEFEVKGAGHNVLIDDINKDGENEMLIGYELFDLSGRKIWTLDYWRLKEIDSISQHADYIDGTWYNEEWIGAIAGSDRLYVFDSTGKTIWQTKLPHPQFCQFGFYNGELRLVVDNQRELFAIYDIEGKLIDKGNLPTYWPNGVPALKIPSRPIHLSDPFEKFEYQNQDFLIYKEGGHPYIIDFDGKVVGAFSLAENPNFIYSTAFHRINDIGASYQSLVLENEILLYSRDKIFCFDKADLLK